MAMAVLPAPSAAFMSAFLPVARLRLFGQSQRAWSQPLRHRWQPIRLQISNILPAALAPIPIVLGELWDGLLQAVPKKKTTHSKTRSRQMAGKALKDVTALNKCPACGRVKRAHLLCPYCVQSIQQWFTNGFKTKKEVQIEEEKMFEQYNEALRIRGKQPLKPAIKDKEKAKT